jgi:ABC-2 type transport system permease protein
MTPGNQVRRGRPVFVDVIVTEFRKIRRSRVTWATLLGFSIAPLAIAMMMWIVREPDRAEQFGLLGTKADLAGLEATWPAYLSMLTLVVGVGGMLLLAFVVAYVFGREYAEGTAKNLLTLPVARHWFALAKFLVAGVWWLLLVAAVLAENLLLGWALALPEFSAGLMVGALRDVALVAMAAYLLAPPVAWITLLGRGYLPPIAFALATLALGDVISHTGWASWFPWSVVPLFVGAVGARQTTVAAGSLAVVLLTFAAGMVATVAQLRYADNVQ